MMLIGVKAQDGKEFAGVARSFMDFEQYIMNADGQPVTKAEIEAEGVTVDEAFAKATDNMNNFKISNLADVLGVSGMDNPLYVVTRPNMQFGAGYLCNGVALMRIRNLFAEDYYIFPSSVHEFLVMPKSIAFANGFDEKAMREMIININRTQVAEEERLSDSLYEFTKENGLERVEV